MISNFKHSFAALLLSALVFFTSCQNVETVVPEGQLGASNVKLEQFTVLDFSTKKLAYNSLSANEKAIFWQKHLTKFINAENLSAEQKVLIKECLDRISINVYQNESARIAFKTFTDGKWSKKVMTAFTKEQVQEIFMLIDAKARVEADKKYSTPTILKRVDCDCGVSSLFIDDCGRGSCNYAPYPGCLIPKGDEGYSCGFMWLDQCNARCS